MDILIFILILRFYFSNNKPLAIFGFLALTTSYFGYGNNETNFLFTHNISDTGLLFSLIIFFVELRNFKIDRNKIKRTILFFLFFLVFAAILDIIVNNTTIIDVLKTGKSWLALLTFFTFSRLNKVEIFKIFKFIILITVIQAVLYYLQYFSNIEIYRLSEKTIEHEGRDTRRGGFPPIYCLFVFLMLLTNYRIVNFSLKSKIIILILILGTVVLSLTRSLLFAFIIGLVMFYLFDRFRAKTIISFLVFGIVLAIILSRVPAIQNRINSGLEDITYTYSANYKTSEVNENFSFRIFHFQERLNYVLEDPIKTIFGLGFVHESSFKKKVFNIGLSSKDGTAITQLDSGDFSWSVLLIRLGFLGICILLVLFYYVLKYFYNNRKDQFSRISFIYIFLSLFLFSMFSSNIANGFFWPHVFLLYYFQIQNNLLTKKAR